MSSFLSADCTAEQRTFITRHFNIPGPFWDAEGNGSVGQRINSSKIFGKSVGQSTFSVGIGSALTFNRHLVIGNV